MKNPSWKRPWGMPYTDHPLCLTDRLHPDNDRTILTSLHWPARRGPAAHRAGLLQPAGAPQLVCISCECDVRTSSLTSSATASSVTQHPSPQPTTPASYSSFCAGPDYPLCRFCTMGGGPPPPGGPRRSAANFLPRCFDI